MAKLQVLCLHGSRQDSEIFSQRVAQLQRKLADVADLCFVDAPHELPLEKGQTVAMRAWWRHPGLDVSPDTPHALYDSHMIPDWNQSLQTLHETWVKNQGYDAILGFSNGASAGFLLACHILGEPEKWKGRRLKCVVLGSGYVPDPFPDLIPCSLATEAFPIPEDLDPDEVALPSHRLVQPLNISSLHIYSARDKAVTLGQSRALAHQFDASRRQILEHDHAHAVPQKAHHLEAICDFLSWFEPEAAYAPKDAPAAAVRGTRSRSASMTPSNSGLSLHKLSPSPSPSPSIQQMRGGLVSNNDSTSGGDVKGQQQATSSSAGVSRVATPPPVEEEEQGPQATPEQLEEMEALQAIYDTAYKPLRTAPAKFIIRLQDPSLCSGEEDNANDASKAGLPPSTHFSLLFTLPQGYPQDSVAPDILIDGPIVQNDPRRQQLVQHLQTRAVQELQETGIGCCYQLVEAAKEWLDANLPPDFLNLGSGQQISDQPEDTGPPWWEKDEADGQLIRGAITQASLAHWSQFLRASRADLTELDSSVAGSQEVEGEGVGEGGASGRWDYVIGLVGKPSAGKSSLFNALTCALTDGEGAKVAAQPFTTIAPNIDRGWLVVPDPCRAAGLEPSDCKPTHGYAPEFDPSRAPEQYTNMSPLAKWVGSAPWGPAAAWRRLPVLIKDVAGLVPGAYTGRGRGNAFLNDLCDADVLIHVVDASGSTDSEGRPAEPGEGADPLDDIGWVREEIHRWIYDNVRRKWSTVRRRPTRLPDLFTGYHVPRAMVLEILERAGLPASVLQSDAAAPLLSSWQEGDLHRLVATFLMSRFPILLALNKADLPSAEAHIRRVRQSLPHEPAVPTSAASERWLAAAAHAGQITYKAAGGVAEVSPGCSDPGVAKKVQDINKTVLQLYGSTGALLAVTTAMAMRPPRLVFPVSDCTTCVAFPCKSVASGSGVLLGAEDAKARAAEGNAPSALRDAVLMKPGSTPADVFMVLKKPPWQVLDGEYVRAECRVLQGSSSNGPNAVSAAGQAAGAVTVQKAVLKKDDVITWSTCMLRIMTNRKNSGWQK